MSNIVKLRASGLLIYRCLQSKIQYLLLQTSYGEHHWTPPKGYVDPGEDLWTTALRETEEEAGLVLSQLHICDFKSRLEYPVKGKPKEVVYWLAKLVDSDTPIKLSDEHQDYKWLCLSEACAYARYADLQKVLRDAEDFISKEGSAS